MLEVLESGGDTDLAFTASLVTCSTVPGPTQLPHKPKKAIVRLLHHQRHEVNVKDFEQGSIVRFPPFMLSAFITATTLLVL